MPEGHAIVPPIILTGLYLSKSGLLEQGPDRRSLPVAVLNQQPAIRQQVVGRLADDLSQIRQPLLRGNQGRVRLKADIAFAKVNFEKVLNPKAYIGRAPQQVDEFIKNIVMPIRRRYRKELNLKVELNV